MIERPPCWPEGEQLPNRCAATFHRQMVYGEFDLQAQFAGWRVQGEYLIDPKGRRLSLAQLRRLFEQFGNKGREKANAIPRFELSPPTPLPPPACRTCADLRSALPALQRVLLAAQSASVFPRSTPHGADAPGPN